MTTWVAATEESTIASTGGALPGRRGAQAAGLAATREPAGAWHAVDVDTGRAACGTNRLLEVWPALPWGSPQGTERCPSCAAAVPVP